MASQLSPRDKTGQRGENVVKYLMDQMSPHSTFLPAGQKTPSIDGTLQLFDPDHKCHRYINVQVKSGDSHVQGRWGSKGVKLRLDLADIRNWKKANIPTIVVWVPGDETKMEAYWRNAQFAKLTLTGVKLKASNKLDKSAFAPLLRLAREHAGVLTTPVISSVPLYPKKVGDVKQIAWNFCLDWRKNGSRNPLLKDIKITLKGWRHLTRPKLSQRLICHKLSLLPCAKEIIETSRQLRYMRKFLRNGQEVTMVRITGALKERHRVPAIIDVVIEKDFAQSPGRPQYTFLSVYERRRV